MRVAVTGGIGSGKSAVIEILRRMGYSTLSADSVNAELLKCPEYIDRLSAIFPSAVRDGAVDRAALADTVFNNRAALGKLNALAHPEIRKILLERSADGLWFIEMPLLAESGMACDFDRVWLVRGRNTVKRVMARDGMTRKEAEARVNSQASDAERERVATDVIVNDGSLEELEKKVAFLIASMIDR